MDAQRRARADQLLDGALDRPPPQREAWLQGECGDDPELLAQVRALLAAAEADGGILDRGAASIAGPMAAEIVERARPPRPVGPYRILGELGRGGMSVVYRAERSDGHFRRRVALKVLRGELDAEELHARLAAERQILASLDHPNIARLLDGGITEDGRPYLVMEYVEGRPLTAYCDERLLGVEARLRLFIEVARAVQHAHARLVVHRDLKPSNILVTPEGRIRLLDFGIAKVLDVGPVELDTAAVPVTGAGTRLFTPEYASPEQLRGDAATVGNDIWALGVVLFELLVGSRPFGPEERRVLDEAAPRLSIRALQGAPDTASARGLSPRTLSRRLAGDLDRIVAMALRKEPERRYASADQFAEDVERHLDGRPVRARPDSTAYRMGRFLRRHRVESAAASLVLLSMVAGAGGALWQAREARVERDRAELEAARSEAVAAYLLDLFRTADPWEVPADRLTARQILTRGETRLAELPPDPLLRATVLLAMGETYQALGDPGRARALLEEALEIRRGEFGELDARTGEALRALADLLRLEGQLAEAEVMARRALEASRNGVGVGAGGDPMGEAAALSILGFIHTGTGATHEAMADFSTELEVLNGAGLGDSQAVGHALVNVAAVHRRLGQFEQAEAFLRQALEHRTRTLGPEHPLTAQSMARLAGLLSEHLGRPDEALEFFEAALEIQTRLLGPDHPSRVEALGGLALIHEDRGDVDGAEALLRESLRTHVAGLGRDHPTAMVASEGFARFVARRGRLHEADSIFRFTIPARRQSLGRSHHSIAGSLGGWGSVLLDMGRIDEAETAFLEALLIREDVYGAHHALVALALVELAQVHAARGQWDQRRVLLTRALEILEDFHPPGHPETARVRGLLDDDRQRMSLPAAPGTPPG